MRIASLAAILLGFLGAEYGVPLAVLMALNVAVLVGFGIGYASHAKGA
jgi:putative effector of murein hydrolase